MCVAYLRMDEHQTPRVDPEESSESVFGPEQAQPQVPPPTAYPFMEEFVQMIRNINHQHL